jgi:hypothetical protein
VSIDELLKKGGEIEDKMSKNLDKRMEIAGFDAPYCSP